MTQETQVDFKQEDLAYSRNHSPLPKTKKKKSKIKRIIGLIFLVLILLGGGAAAYRYFSSDINGVYYTKELEKKLKSEADNNQMENGITYQDLISDVKINLTVKNEKVTGEVSYKVDSEEAYNIYEQSVDKELQGADAEISRQVKDMILSKSDIVNTFNKSIKSQVQSMGLNFNEETGEVSGTILKGKVNRWTHRIEIISQNKNFIKTSDEKVSLKNFISGNSVAYSKTKTGVLVGSGSDSIAFEKQ